MDITRIKLNEEQIEAYKVSLIKTFKAFDCFCRSHDIKYFACGGTLIGAIRHKGIIPWDDDIDVAMLLDDYQKFLSFRGKSVLQGYEIKDFRDEGYYLTYAKFMDANTTIWEVKEREYILGTFIDVFPLFPTSSDLAENRKKVKRYKDLFIHYTESKKIHPFKNLLKAVWGCHLNQTLLWLNGVSFYRLNSKHIYGKFLQFHEELASASGGECVMNYFTTYAVEKELYSKEWFRYAIEMPFEDTTIMVPCGYHEYLIQMYGDYMTPPPIEEQESRHYLYYMDLDKRLTIDEVKRIKSKAHAENRMD